MSSRRFSAIALTLALGCGSNASAPELTSIWGGSSANLSLGPDGGTIEFGCGLGTIAPSWTLISDGQFSATGQYFFEGGPVPIRGYPPHPAAYTGTLRRQWFTLTVTVSDLAQTLGPFVLERGRTVPLFKCL